MSDHRYINTLPLLIAILNLGGSGKSQSARIHRSCLRCFAKRLPVFDNVDARLSRLPYGAVAVECLGSRTVQPGCQHCHLCYPPVSVPPSHVVTEPQALKLKNANNCTPANNCLPYPRYC